MFVYVLQDDYEPRRKPFSAIICREDYLTMYDSPIAIRQHLEKVLNAYDIEWDGPNRLVSYTAGGPYNPYRNTMKVTVLQGDAITEYFKGE